MSNLSARRNALQSEQRRRTRGAICQAALAVFAQHGYVGSSVEQILVKAGVSRAAFYSHFDSKVSLVCAIAEDFEPEWRPVFDHLAALAQPTLESLTAWAAMHLSFHRTNFEACTLLTQVMVLEERLYWQISEQRDRLIDMLGAHHPAFKAAKNSQEKLLEARMILSQVDQICFHVARQHFPDRDNIAPRVIANQMLHFLERSGNTLPTA